MNLTFDDMGNRTCAGTAGAVEAVMAAIRAHAGSASLQEAACFGTDTTDSQQRREERDPRGDCGRRRGCGGGNACARGKRQRAEGGV
jgi:hypothetical protein